MEAATWIHNAWGKIPEDMIQKSFVCTGIVRESWDSYDDPAKQTLIHTRLRPILFATTLDSGVDLGDSSDDEEEIIDLG